MRPVAARPLSPPPAGLVLASPSSPWRTVGRMVGLVILLYLISTPIYFIFVGLLDGDFDFKPGPANPWMTMTGALCSLPLVALVLFLRRPRLSTSSSPRPQRWTARAPIARRNGAADPVADGARASPHPRSRLDLPRPGPLAASSLVRWASMVFVLVPVGALQAVGAQIVLFLLLLIPHG